MRSLAPSIPALVLPPIGASAAPGSLAADVPGLVSDVDRRFAALEAYLFRDNQGETARQSG